MIFKNPLHVTRDGCLTLWRAFRRAHKVCKYHGLCGAGSADTRYPPGQVLTSELNLAANHCYYENCICLSRGRSVYVG